MRTYSIASCIVLLYQLCVIHGFRDRSCLQATRGSNEFDVLMFTQRWPLTACFVWKNKSPSKNESHSCLLPKRNEWTIHGIWPTKFHTTGPQYCNRSPFNSSTLAPIESELKENWIDIQQGSKPYSFWKHEWDKHGTCAMTVQALNSEFKYFQVALKLLDEYNMIDVLAKANILPGNKYMVQDISKGIQKILNKKPQIICAENKNTPESYIVEIRICFDKTLRLMDCDGVCNFPTNCNKYKQITYPSRVPQYYARQSLKPCVHDHCSIDRIVQMRLVNSLSVQDLEPISSIVDTRLDIKL